MATNYYFNKSYKREQNLIEDLTIESIQIYGLELKYLPRTLVNLDDIFKEDLISLFERAYSIEGYVKESMGFGGAHEMVSKFALEIRDTITFNIAKRRYMEEIGNYETNVRPMEGDLIYFPVTESYFEIKYVNTTSPFFQLGKNYVFEIKCELFEFSSERIDTGIPEIDDTITKYSMANTGPIAILTETGDVLRTEANTNLEIEYSVEYREERNFQIIIIQTESDGIMDFTVTNPFGEI